MNLRWEGFNKIWEILSEDDIGNVLYGRSLKVGMKQVTIFQENDITPIFNPDTPKYDIIINDEAVTRKFTKKYYSQRS